MDNARDTRFGFTELIVEDEEAMAAYYGGVYELNCLHRVEAGDSAVLGRIREVIMGPGDAMGPESLTMIKSVTSGRAGRSQSADSGAGALRHIPHFVRGGRVAKPKGSFETVPRPAPPPPISVPDRPALTGTGGRLS